MLIWYCLEYITIQQLDWLQLFKIIKIVLQYAIRTNERLQQMFLQLVLMVAFINGETTIDLHQLEASQEQQQKWIQRDIDLEIIIAEIVLSMIQHLAILIGVQLEMTIFGEIIEHMKKDNECCKLDFIFRINVISNVWLICLIVLREELSHIKTQKIIYLCQIIDLEVIILDVHHSNEHLDDYECQMTHQHSQTMLLLMNITQIVHKVSPMWTEDELDIESDDSRMKRVFQTARGRNYYRKNDCLWWAVFFWIILCIHNSEL